MKYLFILQTANMSGGSKQPPKNEENFSKVKEKMRGLFGFGKTSAPPTLPKASSREVVFTAEILKVCANSRDNLRYVGNILAVLHVYFC